MSALMTVEDLADAVARMIEALETCEAEDGAEDMRYSEPVKRLICELGSRGWIEDPDMGRWD